jgi:hypothetical protein
MARTRQRAGHVAHSPASRPVHCVVGIVVFCCCCCFWLCFYFKCSLRIASLFPVAPWAHDIHMCAPMAIRMHMHMHTTHFSWWLLNRDLRCEVSTIMLPSFAPNVVMGPTHTSRISFKQPPTGGFPDGKSPPRTRVYTHTHTHTHTHTRTHTHTHTHTDIT